MITEDYVSFETAKLLKEKGFDGPCYKVWETHGDSQTLVGAPWFVEGETVVNRESVEAAAKYYAYEYNLNNNVEGYLAPTLQMAMKWLREKYNLHIITLPYAPFDRHSYHPGFEADMVYIAQLFRGIIPIDEIGRKVIKLTPEEACEAAIKYCLENLI